MPALGDEDVCRLDVAVNDALGVGGVECVGNLDSNGEQRLQIHWAVADQVLQSVAVQKLHGDERLPVLFANIVDSADVGMVQGRRRLGLALEAGQSLRIAGYLVGQKLEGDEAMQPRVFGLVDHAHAPAAQPLDNSVVRDSLADHLVAIIRAAIIGLQS